MVSISLSLSSLSIYLSILTSTADCISMSLIIYFSHFSLSSASMPLQFSFNLRSLSLLKFVYHSAFSFYLSPILLLSLSPPLSLHQLLPFSLSLLLPPSLYLCFPFTSFSVTHVRELRQSLVAISISSRQPGVLTINALVVLSSVDRRNHLRNKEP